MLPQMRRIRLIHWKASEATAHIDLLEKKGYQVSMRRSLARARCSGGAIRHPTHM